MARQNLYRIDLSLTFVLPGKSRDLALDGIPNELDCRRDWLPRLSELVDDPALEGAKVTEIKSAKDLPPGWTVDDFPGDSPAQKIGDFLRRKL